MTARHPTTRTWAFPPADRPAPPPGVERGNLRELAARPDRFEHHLVVVAATAGAQLEIATASEPVYFAHVNISDEYAVALPTGDPMIDAFPLRTFLVDPVTGADLGRYNHRAGDVILHPVGHGHWPGRLRPPYAPMEFAPGMRRCVMSLVFCAATPTPATPVEVAPAAGRAGDAKAYAAPPPRMLLAPIAEAAGELARIGGARLTRVHRPAEIAAPRGAWVVVMTADPGSAHAACDLYRVAPGASLPGAGIAHALVMTDDAAEPDPMPPGWTAFPAPVFPPYEDAAAGELPVVHEALRVDAGASPSTVRVRIAAMTTEVPRYWLARTLFRVGLHGVRLGRVETYGGLFIDDHAGDGPVVELGIRIGDARVAIAVPRAAAPAVLERIYRAVGPAGYRERLE